MGTKRISHKRFVFLVRAATNCGARPRGPKGTAIDYERQRGFDDQMTWALSEGLVIPNGGRLLISDKGRDILATVK
jgi:hypothetical protein